MEIIVMECNFFLQTGGQKEKSKRKKAKGKKQKEKSRNETPTNKKGKILMRHFFKIKKSKK